MGVEYQGPAPSGPQDLVPKSYVDSAIETALAALMPVGLISIWPGETIPPQSQVCEGQELSRVTYSKLFAVIGTFYGAGDGSTTFNAPDFRGRTAIGASSDAVTETLQVVSIANGVLNFGAEYGLSSGTAVVFSTTGSMPDNLVAGTTYYLNSTPGNSFQANLASTLSISLRASNVTPESSWLGTLSMSYVSQVVAPLGRKLGDGSHRSVIAEMPSHTHSQFAHTHTQTAHTHAISSHSHMPSGGGSFVSTNGGGSANVSTGGGGYALSPATALISLTASTVSPVIGNTIAQNASTGDGVLASNFQPSIAQRYIIRTGV